MIRASLFSEARELLEGIALSSVPRDCVATFANCANRLQLFQRSFRLLNKIVQGDRRLYGKPSDDEILEYAFVLRRLGAVEEAYHLLLQLDPEKTPKTLFYQANCMFSKWNYKESIPILKDYIRRLEALDDSFYQTQIAKINLLAAFVQCENTSEAEDMLPDLQETLRASNLTLLLGNCYEIETQLRIQQKNWSLAEKAITNSLKSLPSENSTSRLFSLKWKAILESLKTMKPSPHLLDVRKQAMETKHWEVVRECDFYYGVTANSHDTFRYLYFGTRSDFYREKIQNYLDHSIDIPEVSSWNGSALKKEAREFSLIRAQETSDELNVGKAMHRFLIYACQDFYRPINPVSAFASIYPDEFYSPTSLNRIHQLVKRLGAVFKEHQIPLELHSSDSHYKLLFTQPYSIEVPSQILPMQKEELEFLKIKSIFKDQVVKASEIRKKVNMSVGKLHHLLNWAAEKSYVETIGAGPQKRYKIIN